MNARSPQSPSRAEAPSDPLAEKVRFVSAPAAHGRGVDRVEVVETHMSFVFLAGDLVYKLKKPFRQDVLDFSTLGARRRACLDEVCLNRRVAPDVYLGCVPLTRERDGALAIGGTGEPVDWLVKSRRLPAERMLDRLIVEGKAARPDVARVAEVLAGFFQRAERVAVAPDAYVRRLAGGVRLDREALLAPRYGLDGELVRRVADRELLRLEREAGAFAARARDGRILDGHGDLRAEHVCVVDPPVVIDCIEFDRDLRVLDPADELAFLASDCERLGAPWIGPVLFAAYRETTGDDPPESVVRCYRALRALRRAKIAAWHLDDPGVREPARFLARAARILELAGPA